MNNHKAIKMNKRFLAVATAAALALGSVAGCSTTTSSAGASSPSAKRQAIDSSVDNALERLYAQVPSSRALVAQAKGTLVFPTVLTAGLVVGGSYGQGSLVLPRQRDRYYNMVGGAVGLIAGAESKSVYLLFMTQEALDKFQASKGWTAGVDASVTVITVAADAQIGTKTAQQDIIGFVLTNGGLMANASVQGTKFSPIDLS